MSEHIFLSADCVHGEHVHCRARSSTQRPRECEYCSSPCVCPCHDDPPSHAAPIAWGTVTMTRDEVSEYLTRHPKQVVENPPYIVGNEVQSRVCGYCGYQVFSRLPHPCVGWHACQRGHELVFVVWK